MSEPKAPLFRRVIETVVITGTGGAVLGLMSVAINFGWTKIIAFEDLKIEVEATQEVFGQDIERFGAIITQRGEMLLRLEKRIAALEQGAVLEFPAGMSTNNYAEEIHVQAAEQMAAPAPRAAIEQNVKSRKEK